MTPKQRETVQQMVEALELSNANHWWGSKNIESAIAAGRALLAEPAQEPVAQWQKKHPARTNGAWENTDEHDAKWWRDYSKGWEIRALYAAPTPPAQRELSDEDIRRAIVRAAAEIGKGMKTKYVVGGGGKGGAILVKANSGGGGCGGA